MAHNQPTSAVTRSTGGFAVLCVLLTLVGGLGQSWTKSSLRKERAALASEVERPPLYLPSVAHVKLVTLGYNNLGSDLLWFNTINYFGKQLRGSRDYRWLKHMCDLVTQLDPKKGFAYDFCANMLSWEAKDFTASIELLDRAVTELPGEWRYLYLRGFNYWYFLDRRDLAREDLSKASRIPGAPTFLASLAGRLMVDNNDVDSAVTFLKDMIANTSDENAKKVLNEKLQRAMLSRDLRALNREVTRFTESHGHAPASLDELVNAGLLRFVPAEPFGGTYLIDPKTGQVTNSSGEKGLEFFGKTKETGIFGMENKQP